MTVGNKVRHSISLEGVASAGWARHKLAQKRNVLVVHEHFKPVCNAAQPSAVAPAYGAINY